VAFQKLVGIRLVLIIPIAFCLALIILLDDAVYRALAVAALILLEVLRDAISLSVAASSTAAAVTEAVAAKRKRGRWRKR